MKKLIGLFLLLSLVVVSPSLAEWQVYFSPKGGCMDTIIKEVNQSKKEILVQAYTFTLKPIADALAAARTGGVTVEVILDKSQTTKAYARWTLVNYFYDLKVPVRIDSKHSTAHNKIFIIDGETVITGSFNFTTTAETRNAENVLVIKDKVLAEKYRENWKLHQQHSVVYVRK